MPKPILKTILTSTKIRNAFIAFVSVVVIFLSLIFIPPLSGVLHGIQGVLFATGNAVSRLNERVFSSSDSLQNQLDRSREQLAKLSVDSVRLAQLEARVSELETLLNYQSGLDVKKISARLIAKSTQNNLVLVDKGSNDGVRENLAVIVADGHLIGKVQSVKPNAAVVMLLQNNQCSVPAALISKSETVGLVEGQGGFMMKLNYIPKNRQVQKDDLVVTSGLDGDLPAGLIIGTVGEVHNVDTEPFINADVESIIDFRKYDQVLILDPIPADVEL